MPRYWNRYLWMIPVFFLIFFSVYQYQGNSINSTVNSILPSLQNSPIHEVKESELPQIRPYACPRNRLSEFNMNWIICMKRPEDLISKQILNSIWDIDSSILIMHMVNLYPEATFLDLGSNLGPFSVMVASTGRRVIAVDPFLKNLAYIRMSTMLAGTENNVRLIQNTISSHRETLYPLITDPNNEGGIAFITEEEAKTKTKEQVPEDGVTSVTLEEILNLVETDTVIIKIDVEGSECKVLTEYLVNQNKVRFIPYIYMEWMGIVKNKILCPDINKLLKGFKLSGYKPIGNYRANEELSLERHQTWKDVLWVHKDSKQFQAKLH